MTPAVSTLQLVSLQHFNMLPHINLYQLHPPPAPQCLSVCLSVRQSLFIIFAPRRHCCGRATTTPCPILVQLAGCKCCSLAVVCVIYVKSLRDVACQKLLKSANVSRSYSQNSTDISFTKYRLTSLYCTSPGSTLASERS